MNNPRLVENASNGEGEMEVERPEKRLERNGHVDGNYKSPVNGLNSHPVVNGVADAAGHHNGTHDFQDSLHFPDRHAQHSRTASPQPPRLAPNGALSPFKRRPDLLIRSHSDLGPRGRLEASTPTAAEEDKLAQIRHGWDDEYTSNEYLSLLQSTFYMYFTDKRHESNGTPCKDSEQFPSKDWRMKDRMKTVSAALAICLNIGVDPPDVIKTHPCAKLEAWVDPAGSPGGSTKTMELIGKKLQDQYETLSLRTRYKQYLDPSIEETKRFCVSLRRNAKDERVLFHYNGHGVPLPTASGELWVFNKNYTQYIPVGIYDLQSWLAGPSIFLYDVSHAGNIVANFDTFITKHEKENEDLHKRDPQAVLQNYGDCIQLAACGKNEMLPTNPDLPADLFTSCLTTPIEMAMRWFILQTPLPIKIVIDDETLKLPGKLQDRRSPLGELNWIFTAITDTIAWNTLPRPLFKKLFRQDLMVAALFRNFLLADRIMRQNHCHPISSPTLPETHRHPLWQSWDLALEQTLSQYNLLLDKTIEYDYRHSNFFAEQLTAFEIYLASGPTEGRPPDQLPIVLQVLLSQVHRLRALILLSKFLDLGPWAVHLALSIGIFPYVVKLLQAGKPLPMIPPPWQTETGLTIDEASLELKPVMVFIWARIMAVDYTVQTDLLKDSGINYFVSIMSPHSDIPVGMYLWKKKLRLHHPDKKLGNASEHRAMCAFIVATFCKGYPQGQTVCLTPELFNTCLQNLRDLDNPLLRQWSCLCMSMLWCDYSEAKWMGIKYGAHVRLCELLKDPVPEVRAAVLHALTNFLAIPDLTDQVEQIEEGIASAILDVTNDGSTLVRKELLVFLSVFIKRYENKFIVSAYEQLVDERDRHPQSGTDLQANGQSMMLSARTIYGAVWAQLLVLSIDPHPEVARNASSIVDHIHEAMINSPMSQLALTLIDDLVRLLKRADSTLRKNPSIDSFRSVNGLYPSTPPEQLQKQQSYLSLKRAASSLRTWVTGTPVSQSTDATLVQTPQTSPKKPQQPPKPVNTPRGRLPAEWTRAPETDDASTNLGSYHQAVTPGAPGFDATKAEGRQSMPLQTTLLEWSTEYFREPQMRPNDPEEPGSADYNQRLWRRNRNEKIIAENQPLKAAAESSKWTRLGAFLNNQTQPMKMTFHQFDDHLVVTDDRDTVSIWDFENNRQLSRFSNGNPLGSKISDAKFLNEDDQPLLMVGSSDGVLKVYRNYHDTKEVKVVTAFRALSELIPSNRNAGLVFDWQQGQGKALVAGDVKVIKVWNAPSEMCIVDIPARSSSCVTSLTSDQVAGDTLIAGYGDGVIRVFDQRIDPPKSMIKVWREHRQWITNVHMQRGGVRELVSASRNGEIKVWDLRHDKSILGLKVSGSSRADGDREPTLRSLSLHEHAPVLAVGLDNHEVRSFNLHGKSLGVFEPLQGRGGGLASVVGGRKNAIVATAYHPHKMLLACAGLGDGHVSLIGY